MRKLIFLMSVLNLLTASDVRCKWSDYIDANFTPELVGQAIWQGLCDHDESYVSFFIRGMQSEAPPMAPLDFCKLEYKRLEAKDSSKSEYQELQKQVAYQYGIQIWNHYKNGMPAYSLDAVIEEIKKAQEGNFVDLTSPKKQELLVKLHWSLYQLSELYPEE